METIAFLGTGLMGRPMAARLLAAGFPVTLWNRTRAKAEPLLAAGARWATTPAGSIVVDMTSTSPPLARDHAARLAARGILYVDAPVSGGTRGAAAGTLAIMAGGDVETIARLGPVFAAMGTARRVGPVGAGQLCK